MFVIENMAKLMTSAEDIINIHEFANDGTPLNGWYDQELAKICENVQMAEYGETGPDVKFIQNKQTNE